MKSHWIIATLLSRLTSHCHACLVIVPNDTQFPRTENGFCRKKYFEGFKGSGGFLNQPTMKLKHSSTLGLDSMLPSWNQLRIFKNEAINRSSIIAVAQL